MLYTLILKIQVHRDKWIELKESTRKKNDILTQEKKLFLLFLFNLHPFIHEQKVRTALLFNR